MIGTTRMASSQSSFPPKLEIGTPDQADDGVAPEQEHRDDEDEQEDPLGAAEGEQRGLKRLSWRRAYLMTATIRDTES